MTHLTPPRVDTGEQNSDSVEINALLLGNWLWPEQTENKGIRSVSPGGTLGQGQVTQHPKASQTVPHLLWLVPGGGKSRRHHWSAREQLPLNTKGKHQSPFEPCPANPFPECSLLSKRVYEAQSRHTWGQLRERSCDCLYKR